MAKQNVSAIKEEIKLACHSEIKTPKDEKKRRSILDRHLKSSITEIREFVARYGDEDHLDILVNDSDWEVRCEVLRRGRERHHEILKNDDNQYVIFWSNETVIKA